MRNTPHPVVSLRVPGVDFPLPEDVLDTRTVEQVDDVTARGELWRLRTPPKVNYTPEVYMWGFRSTATGRALWLLLLPFTLLNVAYWARPARPRGLVSWAADASIGIVCRLLSLTLTAALMLGVAGVTMDLIGWQCLSAQTSCAQAWPQPFNLIAEPSMTPGQWLAAGALVPLGLLALLWFVSYRGWRKYERRVDFDPAVDELVAGRFWHGGREWVQRLRAVHVMVGMVVIDAALIYPAVSADQHSHRPLKDIGLILAALMVLGVFAAIVGTVAPLPLGRPDVRVARDGLALKILRRHRWLRNGLRAHTWLADRLDHRLARARRGARAAGATVTKATWLAAWGTVGVTVACLFYSITPRTGSPPTGQLPGFGDGVAIMSCIQTALLVALGLSVIPLCWNARGSRRLAWRGFAAPIIATTATMLAVAEAAGLLYFSALSIGQLEISGETRAWLPAPPYPYEWAGLAFAVAIGAALAALAAAAVAWQLEMRSGRQLTDLRDRRLRDQHPETAQTLDRAHARGQLVEHAMRLILVIFVPVAAVSLIGVICSAAGWGPADLLPSQKTLTNLGAWSIGLVALTFVVLAVRANSTTPGQRLVSAVYAMATFWPRAAHPFGAPAHGPRAVADIILRVATLTNQGHGVVLAGHSHGSILAATAVRYLPASALRRTALLTSACPITRLVEPLFAAFCDQQTCSAVAESLTGEHGGRWINLFRVTDPIGGPIAHESDIGSVDRLAPDPPDHELGNAEPTIRGHGAFLHDPAHRAAHDHLVSVLAHREEATDCPPAASSRVPRRRIEGLGSAAPIGDSCSHAV